jgi:hypothetical protein
MTYGATYHKERWRAQLAFMERGPRPWLVERPIGYAKFASNVSITALRSLFRDLGQSSPKSASRELDGNGWSQSLKVECLWRTSLSFPLKTDSGFAASRIRTVKNRLVK